MMAFKLIKRTYFEAPVEWQLPGERVEGGDDTLVRFVARFALLDAAAQRALDAETSQYVELQLELGAAVRDSDEARVASARAAMRAFGERNSDASRVDLYFLGWPEDERGVCDEAGAALPVTADNMARLRDLPGADAALARTFFDAYQQAREKNSRPASKSSPESAD
jgi:hypothetical protein